MATFFRVNIVYSGIDLDDDDIFERLAELPHVLWRSQGQFALATTTVEAPSALKAADVVTRQIAGQVPAARPIRVDEDLVAIPDVAARVGVTREAVRNWANGIRQANFPLPRGVVGDGIKVWTWAEVNKWLRENLSLGDDVRFPSAHDFALINDLLAGRRQAGVASAIASWSTAQRVRASAPTRFSKQKSTPSQGRRPGHRVRPAIVRGGHHAAA